MTASYCDICGKKILPHEKRNLEGAISVLSEASEVCRDCRDAALRIDWHKVVRERIEEARNG